MYPIIRNLLFKLEPETAHQLALTALDWMPSVCFTEPTKKTVQAMGLSFPSPIGLAAGLDKNAAHVKGLHKMGFGFIEVGTVTPRAQIGNPKPRLFRLPSAHALINRMGFNNEGVDVLLKNIQTTAYPGILGINVGKNKETSLNNAVNDYVYCLQKVYSHASYITLNLSSPNTPELRELQKGEYLDRLLAQVTDEQQRLADHHQRWVPLVVKLSPDEEQDIEKEMVAISLKYDVAGIIATNTTCYRDVAIKNMPHGEEAGGLSGSPLMRRSLDCLRRLKSEIGNAMTLIGVGGIDSPAVAADFLSAGASLLQIYTGFIYHGPSLVRRLTEM
ncbi:MAG: quinone-dependent dihydroorotate dehydrogenase [Legionella sp.]|nr:quinone-dependent dihydroorotate dehydrogenase [Legionella sp.]